MEGQIKLARYRAGDYVVNYDNNGRLETFRWAGSKGDKIDIKSVPQHVVDYLNMNSVALSKGKLVIVSDDENSKNIKENISTDGNLENNINTRQEIEAILKGNFPKMKSTLNKITEQSEKDFIIEVAQELKIDSVGKRKFLSEWIGITVEMLFSDDE